MSDILTKSEQALSNSPVEVGEVTEWRRSDGEMKRELSNTHIHVISLGSNIASGCLIAIGTALSVGGPGTMLLAYSTVCLGVWAMLQTMCELTVAFPTSGNFIDYIDRFIGPSAAFAAAFAEWVAWTSIIAAEALFFALIINYWADDKIPNAALYTIFLVAVGSLHLLPVRFFAWFEYFSSLIKVSMLVVLMIAGFAMVMGAGPTGERHTGETWRSDPIFNNGFFGYAQCCLYAVWATGDQVFTGIMGGESTSPNYAIRRATKLVPIRVFLIYILSIVFISLLLSPSEPRLFGNAGAAASPWAIAANYAGIPALGHVVNIVLLFGVLSLGAQSLYLASRILRAASHQRLVPSMFAQVDDKGRPLKAVFLTAAFGVALTYINLSSNGVVVYTWLVSVSSSGYFTVWILMAVTSFRYRKALRLQQDNLLKETYAVRCWFWPVPPVILFMVSMMLLISCIYAGINPTGGPFSANQFFQYMIGVFLILTSATLYELFTRGGIRDLSKVDLQTGRRPLTEQEVSDFDTYYQQPMWRRFLTYFQLW